MPGFVILRVIWTNLMLDRILSPKINLKVGGSFFGYKFLIRIPSDRSRIREAAASG